MPDNTTPTPSPTTPSPAPAAPTPTPVATPATPTPPSPPSPPTPPPPAPAPAASTAPPTSAAAPTSTPSASAPPTPKPEHSRLGPLIGFFVIILAACALLLTHNPWLSQPAATNTPTTPATSPANQTIVIPPPTATSTPETSTSTPETATTTAMSTTTQTLPLFEVGSVVRFFVGDVVEMQNTKTKQTWGVAAVEFSDSRCKKDVVCIWAGERGVHLKITDDATQQTQDVLLGTTRVKTADALGLHFTLQAIDDAKGGTYADVLIK